MTDRATQAAERIAADIDEHDGTRLRNRPRASAELAAIIRGVYVEETVMQHRAEHLERVLAKVREYCERNTRNGWQYTRGEDVLAILDEANSE